MILASWWVKQNSYCDVLPCMMRFLHSTWSSLLLALTLDSCTSIHLTGNLLPYLSVIWNYAKSGFLLAHCLNYFCDSMLASCLHCWIWFSKQVSSFIHYLHHFRKGTFQCDRHSHVLLTIGQYQRTDGKYECWTQSEKIVLWTLLFLDPTIKSWRMRHWTTLMSALQDSKSIGWGDKNICELCEMKMWIIYLT